MVDLVTLVVGLFVDVVAEFFYTGLADFFVMIDKSVAVVPPSISSPILVTGGTVEYIGLPTVVLSLLLDRSDLQKSDIMVTIGL